MTLSFSLAIPASASSQLEASVAKGEVVPVSELNSTYAVPQAEIDPLVAWLKSEGFEIKLVSKDRTSVIASATVTQIEKSLQVSMVRVTKAGITYTATRNAPSLPADIAASVHAIGGLQPFRHAHKHSRQLTPKNRNGMARNAPESGESDPAPNISNAPPYLVSEVIKAYGADNLNLTGKGQVIAILIDTFPVDSDLQAFWTRNGTATTMAQVTKINVTGATLAAPEGEETLDAQWTSGIAPEAQIRIYASGTLQFVDLDQALDSILTDLSTLSGMGQLSISLGLGESFMQQGEVRTQHQKFLRLAAAGVNVFVSSGDAGSNPDSSGQNSDGPLQAEFSSSDPCVVGVGGTTLALAPDGSVAEETGWSDGGGGKSVLFPRPAWQIGAGMPSGANRLVPDVSLTADPNDGALVPLC
jgi:kumamolisin